MEPRGLGVERHPPATHREKPEVVKGDPERGHGE